MSEYTSEDVKKAKEAGKTRDYDSKTVYDPNKDRNDVYFGGYDSPDGPGHGHIVISGSGDTHYIRDINDGTKEDKLKATLLDDKKFL